MKLARRVLDDPDRKIEVEAALDDRASELIAETNDAGYSTAEAIQALQAVVNIQANISNIDPNPADDPEPRKQPNLRQYVVLDVEQAGRKVPLGAERGLMRLISKETSGSTVAKKHIHKEPSWHQESKPQLIPRIYVGPIDDSLASIIQHGLSLEITCKKCSRAVVVDARLIARKVDLDTSIHRLPPSCELCRSRGYWASAYPPDWK
jgi:hypothetical protein